LLVPRACGDASADAAISCAFDGCSEEKRVEVDTSWTKFALGQLSIDECAQAVLQFLEVDLAPFQNDDSGRVQRLDSLASLIRDVDVRAMWQQAVLKIQPKIVSKCCNHLHCYRCHVGTHHDGVDCAEVQKREMETEAQHCPHCSAATIKIEGCNHIVCLCGEEWEWEGDEMWFNGEEWE
jgi:hypothetical protein